MGDDAIANAPPASEPAAAASSDGRLHTLSGAVFLAGFLVEHLLTNASALGGEASFDHVVGALARSPLAVGVEVVLVWLPLAYHLGSGLLRLRRGPTPEAVERAGSRELWVAQRVSAVVLLAFLVGHIVELRVQRLFFGLPTHALHGTLAEHLSSTRAGVPWTALFYVAGLAAASFHLANGLSGAIARFRPAEPPAGRRRARQVTGAVGVLCFLLGTATVIGLATGSRLLPGRDADTAPCGTDVPALAAPSARP